MAISPAVPGPLERVVEVGVVEGGQLTRLVSPYSRSSASRLTWGSSRDCAQPAPAWASVRRVAAAPTMIRTGQRGHDPVRGRAAGEQGRQHAGGGEQPERGEHPAADQGRLIVMRCRGGRPATPAARPRRSGWAAAGSCPRGRPTPAPPGGSARAGGSSPPRVRPGPGGRSASGRGAASRVPPADVPGRPGPGRGFADDRAAGPAAACGASSRDVDEAEHVDHHGWIVPRRRREHIAIMRQLGVAGQS